MSAKAKKEKKTGVNQWQEVFNILIHNPNAIIGLARMIWGAISYRGFSMAAAIPCPSAFFPLAAAP